MNLPKLRGKSVSSRAFERREEDGIVAFRIFRLQQGLNPFVSDGSPYERKLRAHFKQEFHEQL